jgi:hypothetical protein
MAPGTQNHHVFWRVIERVLVTMMAFKTASASALRAFRRFKLTLRSLPSSVVISRRDGDLIFRDVGCCELRTHVKKPLPDASGVVNRCRLSEPCGRHGLPASAA